MAPKLELMVEESILYNRYIFNSAIQGKKESPRDFAENLVLLSNKCHFNVPDDAKDLLIRDQFIIGINNKAVQKFVLKFGDSCDSLNKAIVLYEESFNLSKRPRQDKMYSCGHCDLTFSQERNMVRHSKTKHPNKQIGKKIKCHECPRVFYDENKLKVHFKEDHNSTWKERVEEEPKFICKHCQAPFKQERNLVKHLKCLHSDLSMEGRIKCNDCEAAFFSVLGLRQHVTKCHVDLKDIVDVKQREKLYKEDVVVTREQATIEAEKVAASIDIKEECDDHLIHKEPIKVKVEVTGVNMERSIAIVMDESKVKIEDDQEESDPNKGLCDICGKVFQNPDQHWNNVHATDRPHKCDLCDYSHPSKGHLAQHIRQTHMEAKFICEICGQRQRSSKAAKDHIAMVHQGFRPWPCPVCGKTYAKKHYIEEHIAVQHRGELPFECKICGEKFSWRRKLITHRRIVHENKFYGCNICGKQFKEKCSLVSHIKLVHENKFRYNCKDCGAGFKSIKPFKEHMLIQHEK